MNFPLFVAGRYLFARKSHNVINVISAISAAGMAIGTAALILILSVYNGFDKIVSENLSDLEPDILIVPAQGKSFAPEGEDFDWVRSLEAVEDVQEVIQENVFLSYGEHQGTALAKGVDTSYARVSGLSNHMIEGQWRLKFGDLDECCFGSTLSYSLGTHPGFSEPVTVYFPDRKENISLMNPMESVHQADVFHSGTVSVSSDVDASLLILPIDLMRSLVQYDNEVSALEIRTSGRPDKLLKEIQTRLGEDYRVLDRYHQNPDLYKVMRYEKVAIFFILIFVIIIVAFNIFGSLSMLMIEKKDDIETLKALGASDSLVRKIFVLEGWLISLLGLAAGLVLGIGLALLQQHFGLVKMPGNYLIDAYPVVLKSVDVVFTAIGVAAVGYLIARIPKKA